MACAVSREARGAGGGNAVATPVFAPPRRQPARPYPPSTTNASGDKPDTLSKTARMGCVALLPHAHSPTR